MPKILVGDSLYKRTETLFGLGLVQSVSEDPDLCSKLQERGLAFRNMDCK